MTTFAFDSTSGGSNTTSTGVNSVSATIASVVNIGDTLIAAVDVDTSGGLTITGVTDSAGNIWVSTPDVSLTNSGGLPQFQSNIYSCRKATHASTLGTLSIKVSFSGNITGAFGSALRVGRLTGGQTPTLGNTTSNQGTGTNMTTGSVNNPANSVAVESGAVESTVTAVGTFTQIVQDANGGSLAAKNLAAAGTIAGAMTQGSSAGYTLLLANYVQGISGFPIFMSSSN